jgi:hypothetical protein
VLEKEIKGAGWVRLTESGWEAGTREEKAGEAVVLRVSEEEPSSEVECDSEEEEEKSARKKVKVDDKEATAGVSSSTAVRPYDPEVWSPFPIVVKTLPGKIVSPLLSFCASHERSSPC